MKSLLKEEIKVEKILNSETGKYEIFINDIPINKYDFSYNAAIGNIGLVYFFKTLIENILEFLKIVFPSFIKLVFSTFYYKG